MKIPWLREYSHIPWVPHPWMLRVRKHLFLALQFGLRATESDIGYFSGHTSKAAIPLDGRTPIGCDNLHCMYRRANSGVRGSSVSAAIEHLLLHDVFQP